MLTIVNELLKDSGGVLRSGETHRVSKSRCPSVAFHRGFRLLISRNNRVSASLKYLQYLEAFDLMDFRSVRVLLMERTTAFVSTTLQVKMRRK